MTPIANLTFSSSDTHLAVFKVGKIIDSTTFMLKLWLLVILQIIHIKCKLLKQIC